MKSDIIYNCLFGGGAVRGAAHVGVLMALQEMDINLGIVGGSSVGSIVASLYAVGYSVEELSDIFISVNFELFRDISFGINGNFALSKGDVFLDWIRDLIEQKFYGDSYKKGHNNPVRFKDLSKELLIITTDIKNFQYCEFSSFETPDFEVAMAVRISCCMPGLMRAVELNEKLLVDGDLLRGRPMFTLSKNLESSDRKILEIRLEGDFSGNDSNPIEYVNGMYSCITHTETDFMHNLYRNSDNVEYLPINTGEVVVVDFNYPVDKRKQIINRGYEQTKDYFLNVLPAKSKYLYFTYKSLGDILTKVCNSFRRKKYSAAKAQFAELFIILYDAGTNLSPKIYESVSQLKNLIYSNVREGLLGISTCINQEIIMSELDKLKTFITEKCESYWIK